MKSSLSSLFLALLFWSCSSEPIVMHYDITFPNPDSHYAEVALHLKNLEGRQTRLELPVWAPGYYMILDNAKDIQHFVVTSTEGDTLPHSKFSKNGWQVNHSDGEEIVVRYSVYCDEHSVANSNVDARKAFLTGNTLYMSVVGHKELPATVTLYPDAAWKHISTGLEKVGENTYAAADFDILVDSPIYLGNQTVYTFSHEDREYELAVENSDGFDSEMFIDALKRVITACKELIGDIPYSRYCYILMGEGGGGLEHWNSQADFTGPDLAFSSQREMASFMSFITHEYFHLYNVKAIRPLELGPFDYNGENYTNQIWISEGFTVYYESILMQRAGLLDADWALKEHSDAVRGFELREGKNHMTLARSSFDIWMNFFSWGAQAEATTISYYTKGATLGLFTDIAIRHLTSNTRSLDNVMRELYYRFYKSGRGFTEEEYWDLLAEIVGTVSPMKDRKSTLSDIYDYVYTVKPLDYDTYLGYAALELTEDWRIVMKESSDEQALAIRRSILPAY